MKINNPNKIQSRRNIELLLDDNDGWVKGINIWDIIEEHNKKYKENLRIVYNPNSFRPKTIL